MEAKNQYNKLKEKILSKKVTIAVIGQGYVGLPISILFSNKKFKVIGYDNNERLIKKLNKSNSDVNGVKKEKIKRYKARNIFSSNTKLLKNIDIYIICLPTPLKGKVPDLSYIKKSINLINNCNVNGKLIILESTTYPTTTRKLISNKLFKKNRIVGKNYFVGFSPERISPGQKSDLNNIPKLYCGITKECTNLIKLLYSFVFKKLIKTKTVEIAETSKIFENVFRAVNIALVNEMKIICNKMNVDIFDVIKAASTKPFGFMPFYPGPGWGGHCIPIDPFYMSWLAKKYKLKAKFIDLAGKINSQMPKYVVSRLKHLLRSTKFKKTNKILIIGVTYRENVDDTRESPAIKIIQELRKENFIVNYHDPLVSKLEKFNLYSKKLSVNLIRKYDSLIIVTHHKNVKWKLILNHSRSLIDTRGKIYKNSKNFLLA